MVSYADSLDCVGIMAKEVSTVKSVFSELVCHHPDRRTNAPMPDTLSIYDHKDPTAARPDTRAKASKACEEHRPSLAGGSLAGLRIGIPQVRRILPSARPR